MSRIAILGAGGQVGAEVTLLLKDGIVPICRNKSSSAFLRYNGVACRHGSVTDASQAARLIGDCDVIANFALGSGSPREAREANQRMIENSIWYSPAGAKIIYFSTLAIDRGSSRVRQFLRNDAYAQEKLFCERLVRRLGQRAGKDVFVLRLGHVCGQLQAMTGEIRKAIGEGPVPMVAEGICLSNTVYTATIADAIAHIAAGLEQPGTYDLLNKPQWTWSEVYQYESRKVGFPLRLQSANHIDRHGFRATVAGMIRIEQFMSPLREGARTLLAYLPKRMGLRLQALHYQRMAGAQIYALAAKSPLPDAMEWPAIKARYLTSLSKTRELLDSDAVLIDRTVSATAFPADIAYASNVG